MNDQLNVHKCDWAACPCLCAHLQYGKDWTMLTAATQQKSFSLWCPDCVKQANMLTVIQSNSCTCTICFGWLPKERWKEERRKRERGLRLADKVAAAHIMQSRLPRTTAHLSRLRSNAWHYQDTTKTLLSAILYPSIHSENGHACVSTLQVCVFKYTRRIILIFLSVW